MNLKAFNESIEHYRSLQDQLSSYHPLTWMSQPEGQSTGFVVLPLVNAIAAIILAIALWKLRRGMNALVPPRDDIPCEDRRLIRVRRRRRQAANQAV